MLALCSAVGEMNGSFGVAIRIGASSSMFNVESNKVIYALLTFSPAPDSMAREFLKALAKVSGIHYLGEWSFSFPQRSADPECDQVSPVLDGHRQSDPATWAGEVINFISTKFQMEERMEQLEPISNLASEMLTHLIIASMSFHVVI